jgi:hypothetical protein
VGECDDITYDDVEAYVPRGSIQLLSWLGVSGAFAALDDVLCTASVQARLSTTIVANRTVMGLARGDRKWSLNDGHRPNVCGTRVALGKGYTPGERNRGASRNGERSPTPKSPIRNIFIAVHYCAFSPAWRHAQKRCLKEANHRVHATGFALGVVLNLC